MSSFDEAKSLKLYNLANVEGETDVEVALNLIADPVVDVNYLPPGTDNRTPLRQACCCNHFKIVEALLKHPNVLMNKCGPEETTPLYMASQDGHEAAVKLLLNHPNIDVN